MKMEWKEGICNALRLEGQRFTKEQLSHILCENGSFRESLYAFLTEWWNEKSYVYVQTSGSTGVPKEIQVEKRCMMHSAKITCSFLGLKEKDRTLLCMPLEYIAGKMVVVRALVQGLDLIPVTPSSHPLQGANSSGLDFAAMVPLQVHHSLQIPKERERLLAIRHLIIGGGAIDTNLEQSLSAFPNFVWSTYGMTETLSHIALRRLNGEAASSYYTPFEGIHLSLSPDQTLIIEAPQVCSEILVTNDIAELSSNGRFRIIGRKDNVICSGGIKIQIEEIERRLHPYISVGFAVSWIPDARLGQCVVLLLDRSEKEFSTGILQTFFQELPPYWRPLFIFRTSKIPLTKTGKPARAQIHDICCQMAAI